MLAHHLSVRRGVLNQIFAGLIFIVALYVLYRSRGAFLRKALLVWPC